MSGMAGACSGIMDVFHAQRVCPVENPYVWPECVPPRRRTCVYDAVFFSRNMGRINMLSSPCLCTANSGLSEGRMADLPQTDLEELARLLAREAVAQHS